MQPRVRAILMVLSMALLSACDSKDESAAGVSASSQATTTAATQSPAPPALGLGSASRVSREAEAVGSTLELAVVAALQSAVAQVNGVQMANRMHSLRQGLDVVVNGERDSVRTEAFAQRMVAASQGAVLSYEILSQEEIDKLDEETVAKVQASDAGYRYSSAVQGEGSQGAQSASAELSHKAMRSYWKVKLRAEIAQYQAPDEKGRPKIVVVLPKTLVSTYAVGDSKVASDEVARAVRGRLSDILTLTRRFIVLDREFGAELQAEIDHINSGNVRVQDSARIGQQLATDLLLIPTIERFDYPRSVRKLRMSERELVSYAGGGRISLRLVNAATGQVVMSQSFEHKLASADPSTMPRVIDGKSMAAGLMDALSSQIGGAIVTEIFPVSVVSLEGDQVVLSQGGESLQAGQRWKAVYLGEELKDPQTGNSLGRKETPVGTIRIDRVAAQTSYGTVEEDGKLGDKPFAAGAIELRGQLPKLAAAETGAANGKEAAAPVAAASAPAKAKNGKPNVAAAVSEGSKASAPVVDDKW